jgi:hypothetical protein
MHKIQTEKTKILKENVLEKNIKQYERMGKNEQNLIDRSNNYNNILI